MTDERAPLGTEEGAAAAAPSAAADDAPSVDGGARDLEAELADAQRKAEEYLNDLRRLAADFDNYKKRIGREAEARQAHAAESLVSELLPVLDSLERALDASAHHEEAKVAEGVALVRQQLVDVLRRRGLEEIDASPGGEFDPHVHEALSHAPSDQPEGAIAAVWQRGYRLGPRVVRPARVAVSSGGGEG